MRWILLLASIPLFACTTEAPPPRAELLDGSVGAGAWIYPEVLARVIGPEATGEPAARPPLVYLSRALCARGEPDPALRLGPELQEALTQSAKGLGREARWVDSRAVFGHAEAADSGDVLVCFEPIELTDALARVRVSLESRDGSREPSAYAFGYRDGRWVMQSEEDPSSRR